MPRKIRSQQQFDGDREAAILAGTLGRDVKRTRKRRRLTQCELAAAIGLEQSRVSEVELGEGPTLPLGTWVRLRVVLGRPFAAGFTRDTDAEPRDAGHLAAQELVLALGRRHGRTGTFELPTRPSDPSRSTDVGIRDDRSRCLIRVEIWNRLDDLGRAIRDSDRKDSEALTHAAPPIRRTGWRHAGCSWTRHPTEHLSRAIQRSCGHGSRPAPRRGLRRSWPVARRPTGPGSAGSIRGPVASRRCDPRGVTPDHGRLRVARAATPRTQGRSLPLPSVDPGHGRRWLPIQSSLKPRPCTSQPVGAAPTVVRQRARPQSGSQPPIDWWQRYGRCCGPARPVAAVRVVTGGAEASSGGP